MCRTFKLEKKFACQKNYVWTKCWISHSIGNFPRNNSWLLCLGVQTIKKKQRADIVGFLVCSFGRHSTPLSAIRPLPALFVLFSLKSVQFAWAIYPPKTLNVIFSEVHFQNSHFICSFFRFCWAICLVSFWNMLIWVPTAQFCGKLKIYFSDIGSLFLECITYALNPSNMQNKSTF